MADPMGCDCGGCLPRCLAQAHAEGRAEGLEAAARKADEEAECNDETALDMRHRFKTSDAKECEFAAGECRVIAIAIRALAGQPSGDAKGK